MTQIMNDENKNREALWQRIAAFPIDDPDALLPFSRKLAREQGWTPGFTLQAIDEYKRFIFLCCISPHGASPSKVIDEVWHLHLTYTKSYWQEFCGATLGCNIHHQPSTGGTEEQEKHEHWRTDTHEWYRNTFHTDPPAAFWDDNQAPGVRRPSQWYRIFQVVVFLAFVLAGCGADAGTSAYVPVVVLIVVFIGMISFKAQERYDREGKREKGDGSGSGCSSGDGCSGGDGGCGGGCGGCGGGD